MTQLNRFFLSFSICLLLVTAIYGQKVKFNRGRSVEKNFYAIVPYEELKSKLIIPVQIEGKTYRFLFDTGAPNLIGHSLNDQIHTNEINSIQVKDANDSKRPLQVIEIPMLEIGGVFFKNSPAIVNDSSSNFLFDCLQIDGIIGSNLVRNAIVQIDSKKRQIKISNREDQLGLSGMKSLDMALSKGQSSPYLWISLKGQGKAKEQVLFDTGAQGFYDLSFHNFQTLDDLQVFDQVETAHGYKGLGLFGVAEPSLHYRVLVPEISLLGTVFENVISISTTAVKSRMGADILKYGKVTLDYKHQKFYFEPFENRVDLSEEVWDLSPTMKDSSLVVGLVWQEELVKRVQYGDKILQINEMKIEDLELCDLLLQELPFKNKTSVKITLKDSLGEQQSFDLKKHWKTLNSTSDE